MGKWKVQMINKETNEVEEDCIDDLIFDNEEEAEEFASEMRSCQSVGAETLKMSNPYDYDEDFGEGDKLTYEAVEIE